MGVLIPTRPSSLDLGIDGDPQALTLTADQLRRRASRLEVAATDVATARDLVDSWQGIAADDHRVLSGQIQASLFEGADTVVRLADAVHRLGSELGAVVALLAQIRGTAVDHGLTVDGAVVIRPEVDFAHLELWADLCDRVQHARSRERAAHTDFARQSDLSGWSVASVSAFVLGTSVGALGTAHDVLKNSTVGAPGLRREIGALGRWPARAATSVGQVMGRADTPVLGRLPVVGGVFALGGIAADVRAGRSLARSTGRHATTYVAGSLATSTAVLVLGAGGPVLVTAVVVGMAVSFGAGLVYDRYADDVAEAARDLHEDVTDLAADAADLGRATVGAALDKASDLLPRITPPW